MTEGPADRPQPSLPTGVTALLGVLVGAAVIAILYFGREIFVPFALAVLLSFVLAPPVRWLWRRIGRIPAIALVVVIALVPICGLTAILAHEVATLAPHVEEYRYNVEHKVRSLYETIPGGPLIRRAVSLLRNAQITPPPKSPSAPAPRGAAAPAPRPVPVVVQQPAPGPLQLFRSVVGPLLQPLALAGLVIVFVVMILYDWEDMRDRLYRLAGARDLQRTTEALNDAGNRISRYLLSQLAINTIYGVVVGVALTFIGIPNPALWAITTALLRFIPYLGIVIAAFFPLALAIAVHPGWSYFAWTLLLYLMMEMIVANLIEPRVYRANTGLSSVAVIAAAAFWTWLWGPVGLLLSTPLTLCLVVVGQNVRQLQFLDVMLGNEPVLTPAQRFYQRMLAGDPDEVTQQAEEFAEESSLVEFFDAVAIPALAIAQADSERGALSAEGERSLKAGTAKMLENLLEEAPPKPSPRPFGEGRAACVAGRNSLDETAAMLLVFLLRERGLPAVDRALPADALDPEAGEVPAFKNAAVVCLSLIGSGSPMRARYLIRRIRRRAPGAQILLGLWGWSGETSPAASLVTTTTADAIALSLQETVERVAALLPLAPPASGIEAAAR